MVAKKNITGIKFGTLTVIQEAGKNKDGRALWLCRCDCGEERIATGKDLGRKITRCPKKCILTDYLTGKRVGNLLVLNQEGSDRHGFRRYRCRCVTSLEAIADDREENRAKTHSGYCGNEILVNASALKQSIKHSESRKVPKSCMRCSRILWGKDIRKRRPMEDLTGRIFGRLTAVRQLPRGKESYKRPMYECVCACGSGKVSTVRHEALIGKSVRPIRSCGCLQKEHARKTKNNLIHGLTKHPLHIMWCGMRARCNQPKQPAYKWYGAKGIKICEQWNHFIDFYRWALDNGWQEGLSIDRLDSNGPYSPENCHFLSRADNALKMQGDYGNGFFLNDRQINIHQLSKKSKVTANLCKRLLANGYSEKDVFAYGKLELHQKNALGRSIRAGLRISIAEASVKKRVARICNPQSSEMCSYRAMMARCYNPNDPSYLNYGAKNITVCLEWENNPAQFLKDMGPKPEPKTQYSLDRIDPNGDYSPDNCRWIHDSENSRRVVREGKSRIKSHELSRSS